MMDGESFHEETEHGQHGEGGPVPEDGLEAGSEEVAGSEGANLGGWVADVGDQGEAAGGHGGGCEARQGWRPRRATSRLEAPYLNRA